MSFPTFPTRFEATRHLVSLAYTPHADGSFSHMQLVARIEETVGGFTICTGFPALQELHERSQSNLEEGLRRRYSVLGGEGK